VGCQLCYCLRRCLRRWLWKWSQLEWRWSSSSSPRSPAQRFDSTVDPESVSNTHNANLLERPELKLQQDIAPQIVCPKDIGMVGTLASG